MFRNLKNFICPSNFSKNNNFILKHGNQTLNPANQFYQPGVNPNSHQYSPFELSILTLALSNQQLLFTQLLKQSLNESNFKKFNIEVENQQKVCSDLSQSFLKECQIVFSNEDFDLPVKSYTSFLLASVQQNQIDLPYFEKNIFQKIQKKIQYLDKQGFEDLLFSLKQINYENKKFLQIVLKEYETKQIKHTECELFEWSVDQYQHKNSQSQEQNLYQKYFNDLQNNKFLADQRHILRSVYLELKLRLINRIMFREKRTLYNFVDGNSLFTDQVVEQLKIKANQ